jgi:hypothetical protein
MLKPFDHVTICDYEFVLHYRDSRRPKIGENSLQWRAIDKYGNKVGISEKDMIKLPPMAYDGDTRLFGPTFYRIIKETPSKSHRIYSLEMSKKVANGEIKGFYTDSDGLKWHWDIPNRTITQGDIQYTLEVFSTGGWWI